MQCIWTSASNVLRRQLWTSRLAPAKMGHFVQCRCLSCSQVEQLLRAGWAVKRRGISSVAHAFVSSVIRDSSIPPAPSAVTGTVSEKEGVDGLESPEQDAPTSATVSRIAAQSVRLACQGTDIHEAFLIVKALQASVAHYDKNWYPGKPFPQKAAIDFGMAVSPRLAIHSMLHGLVRLGKAEMAGDVAQQIVTHSPEIRLSNRTLQSITTALCQTDVHALRDNGFRIQLQDAKSNFGPYLTHPKEVSGKKVQLPCTRIAIELFFAAKQYRKQRAKQMFQQLLDACLLQGEILVVSFLFALLVKQWQSRSSNLAIAEDSQVSSTRKKRADLSASVLRPRESFLSQTLAYIMAVIFEDIPPDPYAIKPSHEEAVQALAVLAGMLHEGLLPNGQIGSLVRALVLFNPSASVVVWTPRKDKKEKWERRDAREYFDEVLDDLLAKVTGEGGNLHCKGTARIGMFNSLLHYSLRRKTSPKLAEGIIKRMQQIGGNVAPNITTFNIVLRAGTAFRRHDMNGKVLEMLRSRPENEGHAIMYTSSELPWQNDEHNRTQEGVTTPRTGDATLEDPHQPRTCEAEGREERSPTTITALSSPFIPEVVMAHLSPVVRRILLEEFDLDCLSCHDSPLPADGDTLAAYIDYLTASGRPEVVVKLVKILLPELRVASYPPIHPEGRRLGHQRRRFNRQVAISRAVGLGPIFFTSALNALVKAGKTGLAERTWRLAKAAEGCSWDPEYKARPWILPCAAYTTMMQCYAIEVRKAFRTLYSPHLPRTMNRERRILGWGTTSVMKRLTRRQSLCLLEISRDMGVYIFRSRQISEEAYRSRLVSYLEQGGSVEDRRTIQPPAPDERFFNAALDLFGRVPESYIRTRSKSSPCQLRRLERRQLDYFMQRGCVRFSQDARLVSVLLAMRDAGYEIPLAFRHMLVGITVPPPSQPRSRRCRRAYAHYYRSGFINPLRLPTSKERGLPVRNSLKLGRKRTS